MLINFKDIFKNNFPNNILIPYLNPHDVIEYNEIQSNGEYLQI